MNAIFIPNNNTQETLKKGIVDICQIEYRIDISRSMCSFFILKNSTLTLKGSTTHEFLRETFSRFLSFFYTLVTKPQLGNPPKNFKITLFFKKSRSQTGVPRDAA